LTDQKEQSKEFGQKDDEYDERSGERNGWGVIEEEIPEQWPSYNTQTVMELHQPDLNECKEEKKGNSYTLMNEQQKQQLKDFLAANQTMFAKDIKELGRTSVVSHTIDIEGAMPVKQCIRNMNSRYLQFIKQEVQDLLAAGLIEPSYSP